MCHEGRHHRRRGFGRRRLGRGFYDRERVRERLEEYRLLRPIAVRAHMVATRRRTISSSRT
jgi:hypothetical protein